MEATSAMSKLIELLKDDKVMNQIRKYNDILTLIVDTKPSTYQSQIAMKLLQMHHSDLKGKKKDDKKKTLTNTVRKSLRIFLAKELIKKTERPIGNISRHGETWYCITFLGLKVYDEVKPKDSPLPPKGGENGQESKRTIRTSSPEHTKDIHELIDKIIEEFPIVTHDNIINPKKKIVDCKQFEFEKDGYFSDLKNHIGTFIEYDEFRKELDLIKKVIKRFYESKNEAIPEIQNILKKEFDLGPTYNVEISSQGGEIIYEAISYCKKNSIIDEEYKDCLYSKLDWNPVGRDSCRLDKAKIEYYIGKRCLLSIEIVNNSTNQYETLIDLLCKKLSSGNESEIWHDTDDELVFIVRRSIEDRICKICKNIVINYLIQKENIDGLEKYKESQEKLEEFKKLKEEIIDILGKERLLHAYPARDCIYDGKQV